MVVGSHHLALGANEGRCPPDCQLALLFTTTPPTVAVASRMAGVDVDVDAFVFMFLFMFQLAGVGTVVVTFAGRSADRDFPPRGIWGGRNKKGGRRG